MKGWVYTLQCKSKALDDVVSRHASSSTSCRKSVQSIKDVVETKKSKKPRRIKPQDPHKTHLSKRPEPVSSLSTRRSGTVESFLPAFTELPEGHPSRNVVEIIFHTSWSVKNFPGRVEMVFKVQSLTRTFTRFEEYRELVKTRASDQDHTRSVADGNEVMGFHCLGPTYEMGGAWGLHGGKGGAICTFSGSGQAHERSGGGRGRRAMLVCRVIAGRVSKQNGYDSLLDKRVGFDSVNGENGELLVFDSRAILPCFLIIYKL